MNSLVSVIIPVYNVEEYIEKSVGSVISQTYSNLEVLLVDDGSTDSSALICDRIASQDSRVIVFHKENGGVSSARNLGISKSRGKWLFFVDADDWIETDAIERLISIGEKENVDIILATYLWDLNGVESRASRIGENSVYEISKYKSEFISACMVRPSEAKKLFDEKFHNLPKLSVPVAKLYNSKYIKDNGLLFDTDLALGEDALFNCHFFENANKLVYVNETIYHYVIRKGSAVNSNLDKKSDLINQLLTKMGDFADTKDEKVRYAFRLFAMKLLEEFTQNCGMVTSKIGGFNKVNDRIGSLLNTTEVCKIRKEFIIDSSVGKREQLMFALIKQGNSLLLLIICTLYYKLFPSKNRY